MKILLVSCARCQCHCSHHVLSSGTGAVLNFAAGETAKTITVFVNADDIPEADETIRVALSGATQGATVAPDDESTVIIVIEANDDAAGIFGFNEDSRAAVITEGSNISLTVDRRIGQLGEVLIYWNVSGLGDIADDFEFTSGSILFTEVKKPSTLSLIQLIFTCGMFCTGSEPSQHHTYSSGRSAT